MQPDTKAKKNFRQDMLIFIVVTKILSFLLTSVDIFSISRNKKVCSFKKAKSINLLDLQNHMKLYGISRPDITIDNLIENNVTSQSLQDNKLHCSSKYLVWYTKSYLFQNEKGQFDKDKFEEIQKT